MSSEPGIIQHYRGRAKGMRHQAAVGVTEEYRRVCAAVALELEMVLRDLEDYSLAWKQD